MTPSMNVTESTKRFAFDAKREAAVVADDRGWRAVPPFLDVGCRER
jgi:hypothetical protein